MEVVKRDGRVVPYDRNKILVAIRKANIEVEDFEKATDELIESIISQDLYYISLPQRTGSKGKYNR